jgi:hypothetical protein
MHLAPQRACICAQGTLTTILSRVRRASYVPKVTLLSDREKLGAGSKLIARLAKQLQIMEVGKTRRLKMMPV